MKKAEKEAVNGLDIAKMILLITAKVIENFNAK